jgi:hypothetical protein
MGYNELCIIIANFLSLVGSLFDNLYKHGSLIF